MVYLIGGDAIKLFRYATVVRCRRHCIADRYRCRVRSLMWLLPLQRSIFGERTMPID
ncbi:hypothetical protein [Microcystis sp. LEGE 08355]|uniref:hypothetical protein n=1 Tax=Microcystis sp. LEGE 08355 TaxID=1828687 RepID=UPI001881E34D|nr:hypothetical protein [Microcystis sp. LEGE 08355]